MAVASLIASAIGIILLIVTAYVLVGGSIGATETMVRAQTDMTAVHSRILATSIEVTDISLVAERLHILVRNSGNEPVTDLEHLDVYVLGESGGYQYFTGSESERNISHILDPAEVVDVSVPFTANGTTLVRVITANGVPAVFQKTI